MSNVSGALLSFILQWTHPDRPPVEVSEVDLHKAEEMLRIEFPEDYKAEILSVGLPKPTSALLSSIVERKVDLHDLAELYAPPEIVEHTIGWKEAGVPEHLIIIGHDSLGNLFSYDVSDLQDVTVNSAPIYFYDLDFGSIEKVGNSFPDWIRRYGGPWSEGLDYNDW